MKRISIKPVWTIQAPEGPTLPPRLIELLVQTHEQGSLLGACHQLGMSYRHAWDLLRRGEAFFGATLLHMERGKGSTLSALGEKLVWADHRIHARLTPELESLASELAAEVGHVLSPAPSVLRIQASHGFAIEKLLQTLAEQEMPTEHRYSSSTSAAAALRDGACDLAAFHIPMGVLQEAALAYYARWLEGDDLMVIDVATRHQGLMLAQGNPKKVYGLVDLLRPEVRFINRQAGSGTRFLLEGLLRLNELAPKHIHGFEQGEFTHAAVAAYVASGMADVGFGLETPARQFHLDFIPMATERYFLLCHAQMLDAASLQSVLGVLRSTAFQTSVNALPGYEASHAGRVTPYKSAFTSLSEPAAPAQA
jgi:molybdate transport repressor ModE-like protein